MTTKHRSHLTPSRPHSFAWHIAERDQGQIVEVAYGIDGEGFVWRRRTDRSERSVTYARALDAPSVSWEPWYGAPSGVRWTDPEPAPRAFRVENTALGISFGVYRAPTKAEAIRRMQSDAGFPEVELPDDVGKNIVAIEVDVPDDDDGDAEGWDY